MISSTQQFVSRRRIAWQGFSGGVILTYGHATLFFVYATIRLASTAVSDAEPSHMAETLFLLTMSLLLNILVFTALMASLAGSIGAITALISYWLTRWISSGTAVVATSFTIAALMNFIVIVSVGSDLFALYFST